MSFFSGTTTLSNATALPAAVTRAAALAALRDHAFFLRCDPHYASHKTLPLPDDAAGGGSGGSADAAAKALAVPPAVGAPLPIARPAGSGTKGGEEQKEEDEGGRYAAVYEVVDHLPNPVWSSRVVSREEFVDFADGLWVRIRSPMGVVMETTWAVRGRPGAQGGGEEEAAALRLVEDVRIQCSRLVLGIVRGQVEANWQGIHHKLIARMVEVAKAGA
ncbi:hypothetical protein F4780DRAFT_778987 [Xylariomycetidae sp. FL0641]|nr:hypothetical protein F4780DRAFT_778987 [Xylariomycetidae sp. FL0641]